LVRSAIGRILYDCGHTQLKQPTIFCAHCHLEASRVIWKPPGLKPWTNLVLLSLKLGVHAPKWAAR
jgi:hypothetical protein